MATKTARAFLVPAVAGVFEELGLSAAIRVGAHPSVWDGTGWYGIHQVANVFEFELEQGVELERV
ncbi:MAG TPA: hypothetical protein VGP93_19230, partial [Polyangiaceae bacterium]|nr:hypothetical protein [Polyangiaceae bacterium]